MLNRLVSAALEQVSRRKGGGIIVNEHTLNREQTRRHVDALSRSFEFIALDDLPERLAKGAQKPFCLLTFDDGKRSNALATAPELSRLGVPALFLLVSEFLDRGTPLWFDRYHQLWKHLGRYPSGLSPTAVKQLPYALLVERVERECQRHGVDPDVTADDVAPMTWEQARELKKLGFGIGSHGTTHAIMTRETWFDASRNIAKGISDITAQLGEPCTSFAFPNGNYTAGLAKHAVSCGARFVMTTEPTWMDATVPLWRIPRIQLFGSQTESWMLLKVATSAIGSVLLNPDGTRRAYVAIDRLAKSTMDRGVDPIPMNSRAPTTATEQTSTERLRRPIQGA